MVSSYKNEYVPDFVTHPGETLLEALQAFGMSQTKLAKLTGREKKTINEIVKGKASITPETALQLERVLGIPTGFWIARERLYRESLDPNGEEQVFEGEEERPSIIWKLINKLAPDSKKVGEWVAELKRENPDLSRDELAEYIGDQIIWDYTKQGAALAIPGTIPGLGTLVQIATEAGTGSLDIALMVRNQAYLVFAIGHCFGIKGREILIQDILICIGLWTNALVLSKSGFVRIGTKVIEANFKKRFPGKILQAINKKVGTTVLTKYGTKRGGIAIGKLIPFGGGVVVGGGFNYIMMKRFKTSSIKYLRGKIEKRQSLTKADS